MPDETDHCVIPLSAAAARRLAYKLGILREVYPYSQGQRDTLARAIAVLNVASPSGHPASDDPVEVRARSIYGGPVHPLNDVCVRDGCIPHELPSPSERAAGVPAGETRVLGATAWWGDGTVSHATEGDDGRIVTWTEDE